MGEVIFVTGPARSGKSRFAERLAGAFGPRVLFVATMEPLDQESRERVQANRESRQSTWSTRDVPLDLTAVLEAETGHDACLIDCLALWVSNQLVEAEDIGLSWEDCRARVLTATEQLLSTRTAHPEPLIVVSNEVGAGVVPEYRLGRRFRDLLGEANQRVARRSDRLYGLWAGHYLELKSLGARSIEDLPD